MNENLTAYLITMGCGAAACILWFYLAWKRKAGSAKAASLSALTAVLGILLGVLGARGGWLLLRINYVLPKDILTLRYDELSYYGGMAGVILAVFLSAKITGQPARDVLNTFAPMGALMAAVARFAEGFLGMLGLGYVEEWVEEGLFFPVTVKFVYDEEFSEFYLAVFMLSGLFSLIAMVFSLVHAKEKHRFIRTLFYLCLPQILLECLRMQAIKWLFVPAEQLICYLLCEGVLIWTAFKTDPKQFRNWIPALVGLLACGVVMAGMFALDGKISLGEDEYIPQWIIYTAMAVSLAGMAAAEHSAMRRIQAKA